MVSTRTPIQGDAGMYQSCEPLFGSAPPSVDQTQIGPWTIRCLAWMPAGWVGIWDPHRGFVDRFLIDDPAAQDVIDRVE